MQTQNRPASDAGAPPSSGETEVHGLYRLGLSYGRLMYRLRWLVIALWVIGLAVSVPFAAKVSTVLSGGGYSFSNSESTRVGDVLTQKLHQPSVQGLVVLQSATTLVSDPAYAAEVKTVRERALSVRHVSSVTSGGTGADGKTTYLVLTFDSDGQTAQNQMPTLRAQLSQGSDAGPARIYVSGDPAVYEEFNTISERDTRGAEEAALPIALLVLLVVFGTLVAAVMPLLLAGVAVPVALAIIYAIAVHASTNVFVLNVASIVGLGISIDYSLFMTRRFRDELANGRPVREALAWTVATAGEAILFSGLTVMIGFAGLLLIGLQFMTSFGIGGAVVVAAAVTAALTLMPALLGVLGHRINALRLPLLGRLTMPRATVEGAEERGGFWRRWALGVMRRPILIVVLSCLVLLGAALPVLAINIGTPNASSLPATSTARQGLDILTAQFPAASQQPVVISAQTPDGSNILTSEHLAQIEHLSQWLAAQPHVTGVTSLTNPPTAPGTQAIPPQQLTTLYTSGAYQQTPLARVVAATTSGDTTILTVYTDTKLDSSAGKALVDTLRANKAQGDGLVVQVGGGQATSLDFNRYLYGNFPRAIIFILAATFLLLLVMFRSVLIPLKAIVVNALSVCAAYGVLVVVFQWGYLSNLLGFTSDGFIDSTVPILMFCILFGLSMDYEVFLLSRIREEWQRTGNNRYAVARGLEKTGGVITNAALLFVIVTGSFTFTSLVVTKEIGLGMTAAVLVDATIIRSLLVPATMRLLGRWNWWLPGRRLPVERAA